MTRERGPLSGWVRTPARVEGTEVLRRAYQGQDAPGSRGRVGPAQGSEPRLGCVGQGMRLGPGAGAGVGVVEGCSKLQSVSAPECRGLGWARLGCGAGCSGGAGLLRGCGTAATGRRLAECGCPLDCGAGRRRCDTAGCGLSGGAVSRLGDIWDLAISGSSSDPRPQDLPAQFRGWRFLCPSPACGYF